LQERRAHPSVSSISTLGAGFGSALIFGFIAARLKLPALTGYPLAGIVIGPATPGFVADAQIGSQLAEVGVMLLTFGTSAARRPRWARTRTSTRRPAACRSRST
jgi:predicted Kef-type K+ transport protein